MRKLYISITSSIRRSCSRCRGGRRRRRGHVVRGRGRSCVHEELPVEEAEDDDADDAHGDHRLEIFQPKLVLHGGRLFLELGAAVLESVGALLERSQLGISIKPEM
jgi:hypothetical protein